MSTREFTVYFRHFPDNYDLPQLTELFGNFGEIVKIFVHHTRTYGMVEFKDIGSCNMAIETLHLQSPLNMYVSMAKLRSERRDQDDDESVSSGRNELMQHSDMTDTNQIVYVDRFNRVINEVLFDRGGQVYVPLNRVTGVKRMYRKKGHLNEDDYYQNPRNYIEIFQNGDAVSNDGDEVFNGYNHKPYQKNFNQGPKRFLNKKSGEYRGFTKQSYQKPGGFSDTEENWGEEQRRTVSKDLKVKIESPGKFEAKSPQLEAKIEKRKPKPQPLRSPSQPEVKVEKFVESKPFHSPHSITHSETSVEKPAEPKPMRRPEMKFEKIVDPKPKQFLQPRRPETKVEKPEPKPMKSPRVQPELKVEIKPVELSWTEFQTVHVSYRVDDRNAWVFLNEYTDKINDWVNSFGEEATNAKKMTDVKVGNYCFCYLEEIWCRVVILKTEPKILVRNIDFGFVEETDASELYKIPQSCLQVPQMSVLINLVDGAPSPITDETTSLRVKAVEKITDGFKVHVEFGIYEKKLESILKKPKSPKHETGAIPKIAPEAVPKRQAPSSLKKKEPELINTMFSKLELGSSGILSPFEFLNETKFVALFCPDNLLGEIEELAQMATNCPTDSSFLPKRGDMVAADYEGEGWCRAILLETKNDKYKIAFIDYGQFAHVPEVRPVPKQFRHFPWFSCVCTCAPEIARKFTKGDESMFVVKTLAANNASIEIKTETFNGEGKIEPWNPVKPMKNDDASSDIILELCSGDRIQILCEADGYLYLRTKHGSDLLKTIEDLMKKSSESLPNLTCEPKIGQLVAGEYEGDWYRAVVEKIKDDKVLIEFIDYGNTEQVTWKDLKMLNRDMKQIPFTLCKVKLKGFDSFSKKALEHLSELAEIKTMMIVTFDGTIENGVELITRSGANLTDVLRKLDAPNTVSMPLSQVFNKFKKKSEIKQFRIPEKGDKRILMTDFNYQEIKYGRQKIRILAIMNASIGLFTFCLDDEDVVTAIRKDLSADIQYYVNNISTFDPSYKPETNEFVLAKSDGLWRRAYVSEITPEDKYEIFLVDDGKFDIVTINNIRRISPDFTEHECLANLGSISGLPSQCGAKAENMLQAFLPPETVVSVNIKDTGQEHTDMYTVEIPHVIRTLQISHLL